MPKFIRPCSALPGQLSASIVLAPRVRLEATGDAFLVRAPSKTQLKLPAAAEHEALQTIFILLPAQFPHGQRTSASGSGTTALLQQQVADETARSAVATQGRSLGIPAHRRAGSGSAGSCTRPVAHAGARHMHDAQFAPDPAHHQFISMFRVAVFARQGFARSATRNAHAEHAEGQRSCGLFPARLLSPRSGSSGSAACARSSAAAERELKTLWSGFLSPS